MAVSFANPAKPSVGTAAERRATPRYLVLLQRRLPPRQRTCTLTINVTMDVENKP
jgi:hypothetical protein